MERVARYDVKGKRYIESPYKYYFVDLGLRNARVNFRQLGKTHMMENVIYNELRVRVLVRRNEAGITTMGIYDFLLNPDSLDL